MSLRISDEFELGLDVVGEAVAILAKRGAGKTNTAVVLVEEMVGAGVQTIILDPVGSWWGIRSNASGDGPGLEVPRLGGPHGDVPLSETAGSLIADVVIESGQSLLLDLSDLPTKAAMGRFVTDFANRLYRGKGRDHSLLHLVLEEADTFAPQKVRGSEHMQSAIEQLVRRGRARGIGVTLITQRSAVLSKDVLTQADVLVVMRTTGPHDLRAIREWVDSRGDERGKEVLESLPGLETGEAWIWNPERDVLRRVKIRARHTFDSSRTPRAGEKAIEPKGTAAIDLDALGEKIAATAEKAKADDPRELRKRISELERELAKRPTEEVVREVEKIVEVPTLVFNGEPEQFDRAIATVNEIITASQEHIEEMKEAALRVTDAVAVAMKGVRTHEATRPATPRPAPRVELAARIGATDRGVRTAPVAPSNPGEFSPTGPHQKILDAIAWLESIGLEGERRRVAFLAGYRQSGTFAGYLSEMSSAGVISYPGTRLVALTEMGHVHARPPAAAPTSEDIQELVLGKLSGPQRKILGELIAVYPNSIERGDLAEATGYSLSGTFAGYLSELSSLGVITYPSRGTAAADPVLFIE